MTVTASLLPVAIATVLLCVPVTEGRVARGLCEGNRAQGDKWFDGCKWCVCTRSGPLCSSAECSNLLMSRVEPCLGLGNRWHDGCYQCSCHRHGIECKADTACVAKAYNDDVTHPYLTKPGACVSLKDDRCICGVDGVPACTAEAIDRHAHPATTIDLDVSFPRSRKDAGRTAVGGKNRLGEETETGQDGASDSSYGDQVGLVRRPRFRKHRRPMSSFNGSLRRRVIERETKKRAHAARGAEKFGLLDKEDRHRKHGSLLVTTDNRCRWGVRWYGGGLRCFCDSNSSVTCGDPSFVASRIDGFSLNKRPCEPGHVWPAQDACQICECPTNGLVFCCRSELCPLNFLIQPIRDRQGPHRVTSIPARAESSRVETRVHHSAHKRKFILGFEKNIDDNAVGGDEDDDEFDTGYKLDSSGDGVPKMVTAKSGDVRDVDVSVFNRKPHHKPATISQKSKNKGGEENSKSTKVTPHKPRQTIVIIRECKPGFRWMDGCKRCRCDHKGKKFCDDSRCMKPRTMKPKWPPRPIEIETGKDRPFNNRPFQKPPVMKIIRDRPVVIKPPYNVKKPCGRFKPGDRYFDNCNVCICTDLGPKCTAKSCG